jgi:hypothetical protein
MSRRVPSRLEVYGPETNYKSSPDGFVSYEKGRRLVESGKADFVKHGKAIRMRRTTVVLPLGSAECNKDFIAKFGRPEAGCGALQAGGGA